MTIRKSIAIAACAALTLSPITAQAQFGGLGKLIGGGSGSGSSTSSSDASAFLTNALQATKNVMLSAALLNLALTDRDKLSQAKAQVDGINGIQSFKEADARKAELKSNLDALTSRSDLAGDLNAQYQAGNAKQKELIAKALANLAIGTFRNVKLAGQAPGMISGIGSNPSMLGKLGELKLASSLLGAQAGSLGKIASTLPKVMGAMKLKMPAQSDTTEPVPVSL